MKIKEGENAPEIVLPDQTGKTVTLSSFKGKWVLLYFYPKDDTPGCTAEACAIRDNFPFFEKLKSEVIGISVDSVASHKKFSEKYDLPFILLADEGKKAVMDYKVWGKKKFMGKEFMGTNRTSFLVDPGGKISRIYEKVKPAEHADEVLRDLDEKRI